MIKNLTVATILMTAVFFTHSAQADIAAANALIGKTWTFKQNKIAGKITFGKSKVSIKLNDGRSIKGTVRIRGEQVCTRYKDFNNGKERCFGVSQKGKKYYTTHGATLWR